MSVRTRRRAEQAAGTMLAIAACLLAIPAGAGAQEAEDETASGLELTGFVGALTPLAKLADSGDTIRAELSTKVAFAAELDYWLGSFGIGVVGHYSNPELTIQIAPSDGGDFPTALQLGGVDYFTLTGNLLWRPVLEGSAAVVRPYFGIGAGIASITYPTSEDYPEISDETRFTGSLVGGAQVALRRGWFVRLDIRDYISSFDTEPFRESKMQHDLVTSIGVGYAFH